jgi:hypothetical protein
MLTGYMGSILYVDLTSGECEVHLLEPEPAKAPILQPLILL